MNLMDYEKVKIFYATLAKCILEDKNNIATEGAVVNNPTITR